MEAQQLRIGNVLFWSTNNDIVVVDHVHIRMCSVDRNNFNKLYKPIPLTEEWLVKLGFRMFELPIWCDFHDEYEDRSVFNKEGFEIKQNEHMDFVFTLNDNDLVVLYVHQLQNLYFALTGKEL
jgi:hypothetical protein